MFYSCTIVGWQEDSWKRKNKYYSYFNMSKINKACCFSVVFNCICLWYQFCLVNFRTLDLKLVFFQLVSLFEGKESSFTKGRRLSSKWKKTPLERTDWPRFCWYSVGFVFRRPWVRYHLPNLLYKALPDFYCYSSQNTGVIGYIIDHARLFVTSFSLPYRVL